MLCAENAKLEKVRTQAAKMLDNFMIPPVSRRLLFTAFEKIISASTKQSSAATD